MVRLREWFRCFVEVLKGRLMPASLVPVVPAQPVPVVLARYRYYGSKGAKVETERIRLSCHSYGEEMESSSGESPCEGLKGWLTVSYWKGLGRVFRYNFCSYRYLKSWVDTQVPGVPEVFLKSFEAGESRDNQG